MNNEQLTELIATIPDYPKKGIMFRDITPVLANPEALEYAAKQLADFAAEVGADVIVAPEARGYMFGIPAAIEAKLPFVPVRKPGKLPRKTISQTYELEYGTDSIEMHEEDLKPGSRVLIIDDLLATGGTVGAIDKLIERLGSQTVGYGFVIELDDLKGKEALKNAPVKTLVHFEGE